LRKLGAQRCAEAGATEHQLMALFGWTTPEQAALYTRKANRARLEASAAPLLEARNRNRSVPLFPRGSIRWDNQAEGSLIINQLFE
jgi:hypothetical protein